MLNIEGFEEDFRFPIDEEQHKFVSQFFDDFPQAMKLEWLALRTMDNWLLFINLRSLTNLVTYDDDVLQAPAFEHPEVYKALTDQLELDQQDLSDELLEYCKEKVEDFGKQNDREIWNYYNEANIYTRQELRCRIFLNDFDIEQLYEFSILLHALKDNALHFLHFEDDIIGGLKIFNLNHLALIKVPAVAYDNADADE